MKFVLVLLFSAALGLKLSEHELPDCTGTKDLLLLQFFRCPKWILLKRVQRSPS